MRSRSLQSIVGSLRGMIRLCSSPVTIYRDVDGGYSLEGELSNTHTDVYRVHHKIKGIVYDKVYDNIAHLVYHLIIDSVIFINVSPLYAKL